jgi:hypothetical protein
MTERSSVKELYSATDQNRSLGIEGYHVDNKYVDPRRMREEK